MGVNTDAVQRLYVAYFNRPADPVGLATWEAALNNITGGLPATQAQLELIADGFSGSQEYADLYAGMTNAQIVDALYMNLFGRHAEAAGLVHWASELQSGNITFAELALQLTYSAQGTDATAIANKLAAANAFTSHVDTVEEILGYDGMDNAADARAWLATVDHTSASLTAALATVDDAVYEATHDPVPPVVDQTFILTTDQDDFTGGAGDDTFLATQATLQLGDAMDGGDGDDMLDVSISGSSSGIMLDGFSANDIETIRVKSLSTSSSLIDLSDTHGVTTLVSNETEGASMTFRDIQNVNETAVHVIDTDEDHTFTYDTNAYQPGSGTDILDLTLQEIRDPDGSENATGVDLVFRNTNGSASNVDQVVLHSLQDAAAGPTPATTNYAQSLQVGSQFDTFTIDGNAHLEIEDDLDTMVRVINAGGLAANLTMDATDSMLGSGVLFQYTGAQGDDNFDLARDANGGNSSIDLNTGNDDLTVWGNGNLTIVGGAGNDDVSVAANTGDGIADGRHDISLGDGNDMLSIDSNVDDFNTGPVDGTTTIDAGSGNDVVIISGNGAYNANLGSGNDNLAKTGTGNNTIVAGDGNDTVSVDGNTSSNVQLDAGNDSLTVIGDGNQTVSGGDGNDSVTITGDGNQSVGAGAGNDSVTITGNGNQTVSGDDGNDSVTITGYGWHNVDLGSGDDNLLIDGPRVPDGNIDSTPFDFMTTVRGGDGNDTVEVTQDHWLDADLGAGDDLMILRAKDLTTDDMVLGQAGRDTLRLLNEDYEEVLLDDSETGSTMGIEVFDLRNANITLELTADNFDTAENRTITVNTQNADNVDLPGWLVDLGLAQGMTVEQFVALAEDELLWTPEELVQYLLDLGVTGVDFTDATADGDSQVFYDGDMIAVLPTEGPAGTTGLFNTNDLVHFLLEPDGYQAVDITAVPLSLASGRSFILEGGNIQDIVIADADSINGRSTLEFDGPSSANQSIIDTLRVIDGADITAADLRNVSGLEIIELHSGSNQPATWYMELNDRVINQTTGSAALEIWIGDEVAAGSKLYITLDPSVHDGSTNDVYIYRNSNIEVYINGDLVTEPEFGVTDFDTGTYQIMVFNQLYFTTNTDNLIGTDSDDVFIARSLDQLQAADNADGNDGFDTVQLNFAIANDDESLSDQLDSPNLDEIERIEFNTGNNVAFEGLGDFDLVASLEEIATGSGDDTLLGMGGDRLYELNNGDDYLTVLGYGTPTIDGGHGIDVVETSDWLNFWWFGPDQEFAIENVEEVNDFRTDDVDEVEILSGLPLSSQAPDGLVTFWNIEVIDGSEDADNIFADSDGGWIYIEGDGGDDMIEVGSSSPWRAVVYGDYNGFWWWGSGDDTIDVYVGSANWWGGDDSALGYVYGEWGNDDITLTVDNDWSDDVYAYGEVEGGAGNDDISVGVHATAYDSGNDAYADAEAYIDGDGSGWWWWSGHDDDIDLIIDAYADSWFADDADADVVAEVSGNVGNDTIDVYAYATAWGEDDADATMWLDVDGDDGADDIYVYVDTYSNVWAGDAYSYATVDVDGDHWFWGYWWGGDDTIEVDMYVDAWGGNAYAYGYAEIDGGAGDDSIDLYMDVESSFWWSYGYADVYGGQGDDDISVTMDASGDFWELAAYVYGDDGDDTIYVDVEGGLQTLWWYGSSIIEGGGGDDDITLAAYENAGEDSLVFGTIDYDVLQQVDNDTQGYDTIAGFNFEWDGAGHEDTLDFGDFLGTVTLGNGGQPYYGDWTGGVNNIDLTNVGDNVVVIQAGAGFTLSAANISQGELGGASGLEIYDSQTLGAEARTVVIIAKDLGGIAGSYDTFDVYFVQDVDQDFGAAWAVDLVGTITSATEIGLVTSSIDSTNFIL